MYRRETPGQLSFENFYLAFGGKLSGENRWIKLAEVIPWAELETEYAEQFSQEIGAPGKPFRMALGALLIKEKLGVSDQELVEQVKENPYLQYFIGLSGYQEEAPFDPSMMTHFRKRLPLERLKNINEQVVSRIKERSKKEKKQKTKKEEDENDGGGGNQGKLIVDATCAPADIRYPTDLGLLNEAREHSEKILDQLYGQIKEAGGKKPRSYRRIAQKAYLSIVKKRKPSRQKIRKGIRQQLGYLRRNLAQLEKLAEQGASLSLLSRRQYRSLLIISEVYRQQREMYQSRSHRIEDRIVSIGQPHVRPIVRGKRGVPVEFGAKLSVSCVGGYVFVDRLSWDNFNESQDLQNQVEAYRRRFGCYPESVHADQIYPNRENRRWCRERGIRLSGPALGRPSQDEEFKAERKKQMRQDERVRIEIEGKFGQAKRGFGLSRVMTKLSETSGSAIGITFLLMNLERGLRALWALFWSFLTGWNTSMEIVRAVFKDIYRLVADFMSIDAYRRLSYVD